MDPIASGWTIVKDQHAKDCAEAVKDASGGLDTLMFFKGKQGSNHTHTLITEGTCQNINQSRGDWWAILYEKGSGGPKPTDGPKYNFKFEPGRIIVRHFTSLLLRWRLCDSRAH